MSHLRNTRNAFSVNWLPYVSLYLFILLFPRSLGSEPLSDTVPTTSGNLEITVIRDATLMFRFQNLVIMVDPTFGPQLRKMFPPPDLILLTHDHAGDHFSPYRLNQLLTETTTLMLTRACYWQMKQRGVMLENGDRQEFHGITIEAVPAYDPVTRHPYVGELYHPKGKGNGYIITFGETRVYISGDTQYIPEMTQFRDIDIAFMALGLPYVMSRERMVEAAKTIKPKLLYPYHLDTSKADPWPLVEMLQDEPEIEVRIRDTREQKMYDQ